MIRELRPPANRRARCVPTVTSTFAVVATPSSARRSRVSSVRFRADAPRSSPRARFRAWSGTRSRTRCRSCRRSCDALHATSASRTRRASRPDRRARDRRARGAAHAPAARPLRLSRRPRRAGRHPARHLRRKGASRLHQAVPRNKWCRMAGGARRRRACEPTLAPEAADDLRVLASFIRRPPPELTVVPTRDAALVLVLDERRRLQRRRSRPTVVLGLTTTWTVAVVIRRIGVTLAL